MRKNRMSFSNAKNRYRNGRRQSNNGNRGKHGSFDPSLLVKKAEQNKVREKYIPTHTFADFRVDERLKQNVAIKGYKQPTPIQDQAIPHIINGKDVVGIANTGTGKTAAFLIPLINKVINNKSFKVLIVTPTRELAIQVDDELKKFSKGLQIFSALCIGGASINPQISKLKRKPNFVVGTPGRLKDLNQRRILNFGHFQGIVLDEVDRMLDMGFIHDVSYIVDLLPSKRHSLFFSATTTSNVKKVMHRFLTSPITIVVEAEKASENVNQDIIKTNGQGKVEILHDLLIKKGFDKVLVFGRTKRGMEKLTRQLHSRGFNVASIHGDKSQSQRQTALKKFRNNHIQALLATDVASRGLDIDNVTHVINYDLPETYEDYVHRIGRTGRADKTGVALTFV